MKTTLCSTNPQRVIPWLLLALTALLPAACNKTSDRIPVFPVSGKLVDGAVPAVKATLFFYPTEESPADRLRPVGKVGDDGTFHVSTYVANDGAPAGEYLVTAIWPKLPKGAPPDLDEGPDRLKGRCSNPKKSIWRVRVEAKNNDVGTLDLKKWPGASSSSGAPAPGPKEPKSLE